MSNTIVIIYALPVLALCFLVTPKKPARNVGAYVNWVGRKGGLLKQIIANIRGLNSRFENVRAGYHKFNKTGQSFTIVDSTFVPQVILPPESLRWLVEQPDNVLSQGEILKERLGLQYIAPEFHHGLERTFVDVIRRYITRNFDQIQDVLFDELSHSIDDTLGKDGSWHTICLHQSMDEILTRSINRILLGLPLCRDEQYAKSWRRFNNVLAGVGLVLGLVLPWFLSAFLGPFLRIPVEFFRRRSLNLLIPTFQQREKQMIEQEMDDGFGDALPDDFITWYLRAVRKGHIKGNPDLYDVAMHFHFTSITFYKTTIMTATSTILELLNTDPTIGYLEKLTEEATSAFQTETDWLKAGTLSKLPYMDSAIRETLRRNPMHIRGTHRKVISSKGLVLPSGEHLPRGSRLATAVDNIHNDARFYSQPEEYLPFRFAPALHTGYDRASGGESVAFTTTDEKFLAFGYGRHACPGRWFASHLLKMMLAYILINYDMQHVDQRPRRFEFADFMVPALDSKITIRRKRGELGLINDRY